jgi:3-methyladenine DNA glycosylase/8-oxoguanine DNA glycosylase
MTEQHGQPDPIDVIADFLLDIMERLPSDLEMEARAFQNEIHVLETHLVRIKRQNQAVAASLERLTEIKDYFKDIAANLGDTSMLATVIRPLCYKLRELSAQGKLDIGFTDEEWSNGFREKDS